MLRVTVGETGRKKCFLLGRPDMIYRYLINDAFTVCYVYIRSISSFSLVFVEGVSYLVGM